MIEYSIRIEPEAQKDLQNFMPERCRTSLYIKDEHTRDMIISGYTICYHLRVDIVHIVAVFRQRET